MEKTIKEREEELETSKKELTEKFNGEKKKYETRLKALQDKVDELQEYEEK